VSARLAAVLEMAKLDPAGREYPPSAYVFGALGAQIVTIKKAWETAVLRTHGLEPQWIRGALASTSRQQLETIDLHFNDLRHEAGCRWLEQGWPIHHVQEMLGHANLSQTSKPVAKDTPIEHPPLSHAHADDGDKGTLH